MRVLRLLLLCTPYLYPQSSELTPLEKDFQDSMTGVVLEGQSTRDGKPGVSDDVVIYRGQYAGTWSGKSGGGKIFGKLVKQ
jgi:hypothetical protein